MTQNKNARKIYSFPNLETISTQRLCFVNECSIVFFCFFNLFSNFCTFHQHKLINFLSPFVTLCDVMQCNPNIYSKCNGKYITLY